MLEKQRIVDRIYRFRCVEGWSMLIPWNGFQLCDLLSQVKPTSKAKYVQFISHVDDEHMIGVSRTGLDLPYTEALRIDEAMHPLTILATRLYGKSLPVQNGAPLRLVVPWKYGFKSAKAIVKIILTEHKPETCWNNTSPSEYGFYANVNPHVSHPRWSQRKENKIGELKKKKTRMFNGYEKFVASLICRYGFATRLLIVNTLNMLNKNVPALKLITFLLSVLPAIQLFYRFKADQLGINGLETLLHQSGLSALILYIITLAITPLRRVFSYSMILSGKKYGKRLGDWNWMIRLRRMLGVFCFLYAALHFVLFFYFELNFEFKELLFEVEERPFILAGMLSLMLLFPLFLTSTNYSMRLLKKTGIDYTV